MRWLVIALMATMGIAMMSTAMADQKFDSFDGLRNALLTEIAAAKRRVWLISEFVSDHDIALSLYIAKFRKLDVQVILGQERLAGFLSQHRYLASHQVPVKIMTGVYRPTLLVCDNRVFRINSDLDLLSDQRSFALSRVQAKHFKQFDSWIKKASDATSLLLLRGKIYDYTAKQHNRPSYISQSLPKRTISEMEKR